MKNKKIIAALLVFVLAISMFGCKKEPEETTKATTTTTTTEATTTTELLPSVSETTDPLDVLYDPSIPFAVNPITGLQNMDPENEGYRSVAIVVNNHRAALPQRGISQADAIYEYETEGGNTRLLCVFADVDEVPEIGSIRSARVFSTNLAASNNSICFHFGRNQRVPDYCSANNITHVDGNEYAGGPYFWRDSTWLSQRDTEHTVVTDGENLRQAIEELEIEHEGESPLLFNFVRGESDDLANGEVANEISVEFSPNNFVTFVYDEENEVFHKYQYENILQIDETTGEAIDIDNVFVLYANMSGWPGDGGYTIDPFLEEGGTGYYASHGVIVPVTWTKDAITSQIVVYNEEGEELEVNSGMSYICVVDNDEVGGFSYSDVAE